METDDLANILKRVFPNCREPDVWAPPLNESMKYYGIAADKDFVAAFLAQVGTESGELNRTAENLNYSAGGLVRTWPKRFPDLAFASTYANNPQKIANYVYANRLGNGDEASGDGWFWRGRGLLQVTGKANIQLALSRLAFPLMRPEMLESKRGAALSAGDFWKRNPAFNKLADDLPNDDDVADFFSITRLVNGGTNGIIQRRAYWEKLKAILA